MSLFAYTLVAFILATAVATALFRDILSVIIVFGAYSLGMAILYTFLLAPDVAMTEAAIGAGVTTLLLLLTIARTTRPSTDRLSERIHVPAVVVVGALVLLLCTVVLPEMYAVGARDTPVWSNLEVTQHYITMTYHDTGVKNAVTSVLAAYRGFDTFGEAVVVFAAGVSTLLVLKREVFA
ncbi:MULTISPECIES: DUF4040 domain-containing protein [Natrinema]|uniref:Monovalent cation/H+ antiporter subunit B n=1 Tax=Natrinema gari JCM 14663 TaxID=1230459 RepID=L9ZAJ8_9EURY|nr:MULTISPECIES: DUF4040 domain-containing protein [Natrinema]AFO56598.1 putative multicomponent Na+-H+ antiporter subunit A [Natrinema sp. J7-2]ELY83006.1 monovalent cation/H+ antiporter subunit B [Natrinema gari JCM 14663]